MLRHGRRYKPVLLGADAPQSQPGTFDAVALYEYAVEVSYIDADGFAVIWSGTFWSADATSAEALGRDFVIKYMRPQSIGGAAAVPSDFNITIPPPRVVAALAATETGADTCAAAGVLGRIFTLDATETGADTCAVQLWPARSATMAATETGGDSALAVGLLGNTGAALIPGEANGFAVDFAETVQFAVAVRTNNVTSGYRLDFISNPGNDPKMVYDINGVLGWSPHNLYISSEDLTSPSLAGSPGLVTVVSPTKIAEQAGTGGHTFTGAPGIATVVGRAYCYWVEATAGACDRFMLYGLSLGGNYGMGFDLTNGVTFAVSGIPTTNVLNSGILPLGGGRYRCWVALASVATPGAPALYMVSGTAINYAGTAGRDLNIHCQQINRGLVPTTYVTTLTAMRTLLPQGYDPVTHAPQGVLCEPVTTNRVTHSAMGRPGFLWQVQGGVGTTSAEMDPSGGFEAIQVAVTPVTGPGSGNNVFQFQSGLTNGASYTGSMWLKGTAGQQIYVSANSSQVGAHNKLITFTGQWQRVDSTVVISGTGGYFACECYNRGGGANLPAVTFHAWGAQYELSIASTIILPTSYVPTFAAAVTRATDVYSVTAPSIGSSGNAAGSWWVEVYILSGGFGSERVIGTTGSTTPIHHNSTNFGAYSPLLLTSTIPSTGAVRKVAVAYQANDLAITADGLVPSATVGDMAFLLTGVNPVLFGSGGATTLHGWFRKAVYRPRRISNDEMQRETGYAGLFGGEAMLAAETTGVGIDFTHPTENAVAVKT